MVTSTGPPETHPGVEICAPVPPAFEEVLTDRALELVATLHRSFDGRRLELLERRRRRQAEFDAGRLPAFLSDTREIRQSEWQAAPVPGDLVDRRVEITGPVDRKMIINALNAPVRCFMADFEDSCSPTWRNIVEGQINLRDAVRRTIELTHPVSGKRYALNERIATLIVRPRGWHLVEKHVLIDGQPVSGALFDFALYLFHNAETLIERGSGPYYYLPKLESHLEARLWNDVFVKAQEELGLPHGSIKATVLIETILAAFEMDEILYELREHSAGLNCGRWDYIFSFIKRFRNRPEFVLPDRAQVTMDRHFLRAYVELLIQTCHRRGAHAMGGMAAQIPIKDDAAANRAAIGKVRDDKLREARAGHDGTWIAHPGLAPVAMEAFGGFAGPNQLDVLRQDVRVGTDDLLVVPDGTITEAGFRHNISVGIQYLEAWLGGNGCVPLYHLMEDAATAEICRMQLWQWLQHGASLESGAEVTPRLFDDDLARTLDSISSEVDASRFQTGRYERAANLLADMVRSAEPAEFLTLVAYDELE